ncbi:MAG: MBL fold metallo-hydrolase [Paracoccaceae bacterium]|nr:MBL fold metallo-hydrolase [Paracoccaceae bacterium]
MKIRIHRGTKEIGGTCIEVESQGKRIVLDIGLPLDAPEDEESQKNLLPEVSGFEKQDDSLLGALISHSHIDHYGLASKIKNKNIPVWIGEGAHNIMRAAVPYVPNGFAFDAPNFLKNRQLFDLGPFRITPYLVDHSAFDAYAFLIEADGKSVFYSADFRAHGRKSYLFKNLLANPPSNIDVLLMEGTTIGRLKTMKGFKSEQELEEEFYQAFNKTEGLHFVWTSTQNIDRIVTIFKAAKRAKRLLIIDLYLAEVLKATGHEKIPQSDWCEVKVYIPQLQRVFIKKNKLFSNRDQHKKYRIYPQKLIELSKKSVMIFRPRSMHDKGIINSLDGAALTYSMWEGYLKQDSSQKVLDWLRKNNIPQDIIHTSGHASVVDLKKFAEAVNPNRLVPIHTFEPEKYSEHFNNVEYQQDGQWWDV